MAKVSVLGSGSWGTAMAMCLANNGHNILVWCRSDETANQLKKTHIKYHEQSMEKSPARCRPADDGATDGGGQAEQGGAKASIHSTHIVGYGQVIREDTHRELRQGEEPLGTDRHRYGGERLP